MEKVITRECEHCVNTYTPYNKQQKYCSKKCQSNCSTKKKSMEAFRAKRREMINIGIIDDSFIRFRD